jgi:hypothetical protein
VAELVSLPPEAFIRTEVRMRSTADGGRRNPIFSGYRCNCWIGARTPEGEKAYNDAAIYLESQDRLEPGETAMARLQPAVPEYWTHVDVGLVIELCEGSRVKGEATVVELLSRPRR